MTPFDRSDGDGGDDGAVVMIKTMVLGIAVMADARRGQRMKPSHLCM